MVHLIIKLGGRMSRVVKIILRLIRIEKNQFVEVGSFLEKIHGISLPNFARMRYEHARLNMKCDTIPSAINLKKKEKKKRKILFLLIYLTLLSDLDREWVNLSAILVPLIVTKDCTNVLHGIDKSLRITLYHVVSKRSRNPTLFSSLSSRFLEHPIRSDFRKSKKGSLLGTLVNVRSDKSISERCFPAFQSFLLWICIQKFHVYDTRIESGSFGSDRESFGSDRKSFGSDRVESDFRKYLVIHK